MVAVTNDEARTTIRPARLAEGAWAALLVAVFAGYYVAPGLPLSLALLAACAALCYLRLPLAVSLVPLAMPFFMLPKHLGQHLQFSLGETAIVLCATAYALHYVRALGTGERMRVPSLRDAIRSSTLGRAVVLFVVAATLATLTAHDRHLALRQYRWVMLEPIVYYLLVVTLLREPAQMARAVGALVASGLLVAILGLGQYLFRPNTLTGVYYTGYVPHPLHLVTSVYGSPDNLGLLLDRAIPVAVVLVLALLLRRSPRPTPVALTSPVLPWLGGLAVLLMGVAMVLSNSRGGIITALAVGLLAAYLWYGRRDRRIELAGAAGVVAVAVAVLVKAQHGASASDRLYVWGSSLRMIRDHLLLGVGPDNFLYYYVDPRNIPRHNPAASDCPPGLDVRTLPATHYMDSHVWQQPCLSHPHNVILDAWLSTGLAGLVALALVLVCFAVLAHKVLRAFPDGLPRAVQVAAVAIVMATLVHGMVDNSLFVPDLAIAFWLAVALTANLSHRLGGPANAW